MPCWPACPDEGLAATRCSVAVDPTIDAEGLLDGITPNDLVAFLVEVSALVLVAIWGWRQGDSTVMRVLAAVAVPVAAGILWSLFAAPRSRFDVRALEVATKVVVLGGAVLAARTILPTPWWWAFLVVVVTNTALLYVGPWGR